MHAHRRPGIHAARQDAAGLQILEARGNTGIPGQPVLVRRRPPAAAAAPGQGGIPSAPAGAPPEPLPRVVIENANGPRATVVPRVEGIAHVILAVEDDGTPSLSSYRRVILNMKPDPAPTRP